MKVIIEYADAGSEELGYERYLTRVWKRDRSLLKARVRLSDREHMTLGESRECGPKFTDDVIAMLRFSGVA